MIELIQPTLVDPAEFSPDSIDKAYDRMFESLANRFDQVDRVVIWRDVMEKNRLGQCRNHSVCHGCQHTQLSSDTSESWCYMFKDGAFLETQGYCAQYDSYLHR